MGRRFFPNGKFLDFQSGKRRLIPEGNTPGKPPSKTKAKEATTFDTSSPRKSLFGNSSERKVPRGPWTRREEAALVQYICLYWENAGSNVWPTGLRDPSSWSGCSSAIKASCSTYRSGICTHFSGVLRPGSKTEYKKLHINSHNSKRFQLELTKFSGNLKLSQPYIMGNFLGG